MVLRWLIIFSLGYFPPHWLRGYVLLTTATPCTGGGERGDESEARHKKKWRVGRRGREM